MLCSKLHCHEGFTLKPCFYKIVWAARRPHSGLRRHFLNTSYVNNPGPTVGITVGASAMDFRVLSTRHFPRSLLWCSSQVFLAQLKAQGASRTCNESKEEEEEKFLANVDAHRKCGQAPP